MENQLIIIGTIIVEHEGTEEAYERAKEEALDKLSDAGFVLGDVEYEDYEEDAENEFQ